MITSIDAKKALGKIQHMFTIKTRQTRNKGELDLIKNIYKNHVGNIIFNSIKLKTFLLRSLTMQKGPVSPFFFQHCTGSPI